MFIRDEKGRPEITAGDGTRLIELLNPLKDPVALGYSLARAVVGPGAVSILHRLRSSEVYYVIEGEGEMEIEGERAAVGPGQAVYIPPGSAQRIRNTGRSDLVFICMVDPAWRKEDEEILG